ncbi:MAG: iron ABC transporter permease [Thermoplasmata archaeon]|nr:iron ABC transporter permease [Thermoplasmata archaeon]
MPGNPTPGTTEKLPGANTQPRRRLRWISSLLLAGVLLGLLLLSPLIGPVPIPPGVVLSIGVHGLTGGALAGSACSSVAVSARQCAIWTEIVWQARMPAIVLALAAGAALGLSGGSLQGVFRNPLADPYLLGLSTGAAMGASLIFVFRIGLASAYLVLPLFAFLGGLIPGIIVYWAAGRARAVETLVLTGVALSAFFSAMLAAFLLVNPLGEFQVSFWLLGGMAGATWGRAGIVFGGVLIAGGVAALRGRELNVLQLGPDVASSLGVDGRRVARQLILTTTLLTATAVAFTGVIGFVGLVSPHIVRRLVGPDYRAVLPLSALFGGAFLASAWDLAQVVVPAIVLPVGIPTAFAGAPFFLYLLYRRRTPSEGPRT